MAIETKYALSAIAHKKTGKSENQPVTELLIVKRSKPRLLSGNLSLRIENLLISRTLLTTYYSLLTSS